MGVKHEKDSIVWFPYLIIELGLGLLAGFPSAPHGGKETRDEFRRGADDLPEYRNISAEIKRNLFEQPNGQDHTRIGQGG
jgi:hypothetical protein